MRVKISAASMRQPFHGCEPTYIAKVCHASCCDSSASPTGTLITIHPVEERTIRRLGGRVKRGLLQPRRGERRCPFKTETSLCELHGTETKPFGCIVSPFTLNANDTLVIRNRYRLLRCYKDNRDGLAPSAYLAFAESLVLLFGRRKANEIARYLDDGGGDLSVDMSELMYNMVKDNDDIKRQH